MADSHVNSERESYEKARTEILAAAKQRREDILLADRGIVSLPPEIGQCAHLEVLNLRNNRLTALPPEIGKCSRLKVLRLDFNPLKDLPPELRSCHSLQSLSLGKVPLSALPFWLAECPELSELNLTGVATLKEWPQNNSGWESLRTIILSDCGLQTVPNIAQCRQLRRIHLDGNRLDSLPASLRELESLERLFLHRNDALGLPSEVLGPSAAEVADGQRAASARAILDFYFTRVGDGARPLDEVKLVLVGRGGTGKSSLVDRTVFAHFDENKTETRGIALCDWRIPNCPGGGPVTAHVWDFAGQVITHSAHQFFFSVRTIYILVLTGRENSEREDAEYWLRLISAFGTDESGVGPPTIIALNKWDDDGAPRAKVDRRALRERYPFIVNFVETDCKTNRGIARLKDCLAETAGKMEWVRVGIANTWSAVKSALSRSRDPHMAYDDFQRVCANYGVTNPGEQDSLAETLHRLGVALNYRKDQRLREATVLKPHWLTDNVYKLVRFAAAHDGFIRREKLPVILDDEPDARMRRYLVDLMIRFEIAYPLGEDNEQSAGWLAPQGLPDSQPDGVESFSDAVQATRLRYTYRALSKGLVPRFIVRTHPFIEGERRWASGVVLELDAARALVRASPEDKIVEITVTGPKHLRQQLAGLCQAEFRSLHAEIRGLNPIEAMLVDGDWVPVETLERDERAGRTTGVRTGHGTIDVNPSEKLNDISEPAARDDSWKPHVFISYARADETKRKTLDLQLKILAKAGLLEGTWHDRKLQPGDDFDIAIRAAIERADVFVFLVSAASLGSDYIQSIEMALAIKKRASGRAHLVAIILEPCLWKIGVLAKWQVLPRNGKPLTDWNPRANGWYDVADALRELFESLRDNHSRRPNAVTGAG